MKRLGLMPFAHVLRAVLERSACGVFAQVAIYVVALSNPAGRQADGILSRERAMSPKARHPSASAGRSPGAGAA